MDTEYLTERQIDQEMNFQKGRTDRREGLPCRSANGAYLIGWYNPEKPCYYVTLTELDELMQKGQVTR